MVHQIFTSPTGPVHEKKENLRDDCCFPEAGQEKKKKHRYFTGAMKVKIPTTFWDIRRNMRRVCTEIRRE